MAKKIRDYQARAVRLAKKHLATNSRGKVVWPCGLGKTFFAIALAKSMKSQRIVVCVPSLALVQQTLREWTAEYDGKGVDWLCVCSDKTVRNHTDEWDVDPSELGIAVSTSPKEIGKFLRKRTGNLKVVFCTYHSGERLAQAATRFRFDLAIFDEAHKTAGTKGAVFSKLLDDENIKIDKRLFMTATERFYRGQRDDVVSMSDEKVYGELIDSISFKQAMDTDQLCDYDVAVMSVTQEEINRLIAENEGVTPGGSWDAVEAMQMAAMIAMRKVIKEKKIKRIISFHSTVARAQQFRTLNENFNDHTSGVKVQSIHINGAQPSSVREENVEAFRNSKRALVTNCRCLTEGVDIPSVDAVVFADPRNSTVDIVQAVGRAIRKSEGKKRAYVIIPVIVSEMDSVQVDMFDSALDIIRQLASVDERIIAQFNPQGGGRSGPPGPVVFDEIVGSKIELDQFHASIEVRYWNRLKGLVPFLSFEDAREYMHGVGLCRKLEWEEWNKSGARPADIPYSPEIIYKDRGWSGIADFLGYSPKRVQKLPFKEARDYMHSIGLGGMKEWNAWRISGLMPSNIPYNPSEAYKGKGWAGFPDFIGYKQKMVKGKLSFKDARDYMHSIGLKSIEDWHEWRKSGARPQDIPCNPEHVYKNSGWAGTLDFLGCKTQKAKNFLPFEESRAVVRTLGLTGQDDWYAWAKSPLRPTNIPSSPYKTYKDSGWKGWPDFLGYEPKQKRKPK